MSIKLKSLCSALVFLFGILEIANAATVKNIQVYNNLYNQASTAGGITPTAITVKYFNGATQCDSSPVTFRNLTTEIVGTGANQKCADVTSLQIVAGTSIANTILQVYSATPVVVNLTAADYEHAIIIQDLGTGVSGTPASDGSIAPIFNAADGTVQSAGTLGIKMIESKIRLNHH